MKKEENKRELRYPAEGKIETSNPLLKAQVVLCAVLLLLLWGMGYFFPEAKQQLVEQYRVYLNKNRVDTEEELLRFAGNFSVKALPIPAMGGSGQTQKPENYSEEGYLPEREIIQPLERYIVTSQYGWRENPLAEGKDFHTGIDLAAGQGTPIAAALEGTVLKAGYSKSYGNYILISHGQEDFTLYAHMQYLFARVGQRLKQGQTIGTVGATGNVTGPHLHFELFHLDTGYDPAEALGL